VGVQNLVKWAKNKERRSDLLDTAILGRMYPLRVSSSYLFTFFTAISTPVTIKSSSCSSPSGKPPPSQPVEATDINPIRIRRYHPPHRSRHFSSPPCRIKSGTTNEQFRRWCLANKKVCLPFNVIMVEITFGGSNAPICHGAGLSTSTLSDLVAEVQYVDANGVLQSVSDPEELKAAAGCFGLVGPCDAVDAESG
jgi:hypothetical protein